MVMILIEYNEYHHDIVLQTPVVFGYIHVLVPKGIIGVGRRGEMGMGGGGEAAGWGEGRRGQAPPQ